MKILQRECQVLINRKRTAFRTWKILHLALRQLWARFQLKKCVAVYLSSPRVSRSFNSINTSSITMELVINSNNNSSTFLRHNSHSNINNSCLKSKSLTVSTSSPTVNATSCKNTICRSLLAQITSQATIIQLARSRPERTLLGWLSQSLSK